MSGRERHPFLSGPVPIAFAHRGGALEAEENTLAAFEHAVALGYRYIETDVQATRDGVAVVFHDESLLRMTGEDVAVGSLTWAELSARRTRGGAPILRLDALFARWPDLRINIEPKSDAAVAPLAAAIAGAGALGRVCVGSFSAGRIARLRALLGPGLCWSPARGGVARLWLAGWGLPVGAAGFDAVQVPAAYAGLPVVTQRFVRAAHARGLQVHVWTVDDEAEMERLLDLGVDGIMTDRPAVLRALLVRRGQWTGANAPSQPGTARV